MREKNSLSPLQTPPLVALVAGAQVAKVARTLRRFRVCDLAPVGFCDLCDQSDLRRKSDQSRRPPLDGLPLGGPLLHSRAPRCLPRRQTLRQPFGAMMFMAISLLKPFPVWLHVRQGLPIATSWHNFRPPLLIRWPQRGLGRRSIPLPQSRQTRQLHLLLPSFPATGNEPAYLSWGVLSAQNKASCKRYRLPSPSRRFS